MFRWTVVSVVLVGLASRFVVKEVFSKRVYFIFCNLGFAGSVSFCLPQVVEVSALSMLSNLPAFSLVILVCSAKLSFGSSVTPSILGFLTVGMRVLVIRRFSVLLYSAGSGVKGVAVDLSGFRIFFCPGINFF